MILLASAAAVTVGLDLSSKQLALEHLAERGAPGPRAWFALALVRNRRGAVIATSRGQAVALWLAAGSLLVAAAVSTASLPPLCEAGFGLMLGGATGNLVERLWSGGVTDFLFIRHWPVFNLADTAMLCGFLLVLGGLR